MPRVSIVLPTYNGKKYLEKSIGSVLAQSFTDWELIIVDDCSTDDTYRITEAYAKLDSRIKVIHNAVNKKLPASLNVGFEASTGEYLTWTSDDNLFEIAALEKMVEYLDKNQNIPMVRTDMYIIDEADNVVSDSEAYQEDKMYVNNYVGACFLYRKEAAMKVGEYDTSLFCVEDYDFWIRILKYCGSIGNITDKLYKYRVHGGSLSSTKRALVESQLSKMRRNHMGFFLDKMSKNDEAKVNLYFMMLNCGYDRSEIIEHFKGVDIIEMDTARDNNRLNVVYGAGYYGDKVYELLSGDINFYIDKNQDIIGSTKNNIEIKSIESYLAFPEKYNLIIALSIEHSFNAIVQLITKGVNRFTSYQNLEYWEKKD